jgi:hypothetical protein
MQACSVHARKREREERERERERERRERERRDTCMQACSEHFCVFCVRAQSYSRRTGAHTLSASYRAVKLPISSSLLRYQALKVLGS